MKNPSPGSRFGGFGRPGDGTVPMGAALTATMRRTSVAFIASAIARVPCHAIPASEAPIPPVAAKIVSLIPLSLAGSWYLVFRTSDGTVQISYGFHIVNRFGPPAPGCVDQAVAAGAEHPALAAQPPGGRACRTQRRGPRLP